MEKFHQAPNVYVSEVGIKVMDLERSIKFYESIIGLRVLEQSAGKAVLTADGKLPLVTLEQPADIIPLQGRHSGLYHFALLMPTRADLGVFLQHLVQTNYRFGAGDHLVSEALYITDPDGNGIEVYIDRPHEEWAWKLGKVEMATLQIDANAIVAAGGNTPWTGMPAGTIMGHIHLHVGDTEKAEQFYKEAFHFETVAYYPQAAFMSTGGYHHHIAVNTWQGVGAPTPPRNMVGLIAYTMVFPDTATRQGAVERIGQMGVSISEEAGNYLTQDPSGNQIRLVVGQASN
ncbi:MAG: VOC family protein [Candidatus Cohnella colombiensis]|uniref:VOC family protein n=1 Tax=Candidatus Cohnella colombiensis TaxID=3121368 RepID=A0AA95JFQ9_9BACL|nr:MAG: VOC family protein [Cohnella sp.]